MVWPRSTAVGAVAGVLALGTASAGLASLGAAVSTVHSRLRHVALVPLRGARPTAAMAMQESPRAVFSPVDVRDAQIVSHRSFARVVRSLHSGPMAGPLVSPFATCTSSLLMPRPHGVCGSAPRR
jgi:hypothetical protein